MKNVLLALAFLVGSVASAAAACTGPAVMHDFPGTSFNMSLSTNGDGNCQSNVSLPSWAGGVLGAMANYGTSPGAVLVPGVNAFITNVPAVSQSGTWSVTVSNANANGQATAANSSPVVAPVLTVAGAAVVKGGVPVVNGASTYQHVAASQTGAVLQTSTGAIGDYLSHCVIYPGTTAAGSVTVFDNANAAATNVIEFTTGTLSNLAPITIPVGAVSTAGAWKVTTGANETVVCYGKFS